MRKNNSVRNMTLFSMFLAIELILLFTPLGFIKLPGLSITLMHIPVIAAAILLGWKAGAGLGLVFGICSVWNSTMNPGLTAFIFSPFVTVAGVSGNWTSLLIAIVPRVLLGLIAAYLFRFLSGKMPRAAAAGISAAAATLCHTFMVLGLIALLWGPQYAAAIGQAPDALLFYLGMVVLTNGMGETGLAAVVMMALAKAIKPAGSPAVHAGKD